MKRIIRIFDNGNIAEMTSGLSITISGKTYEDIDVTNKTRSEIEKIKTDKKEKIDKEPK